MAEPGPQVQDVPTPNPPPVLAQAGQQALQQQQDQPAPPRQVPAAQQPGQQIVQLNWSHLNQYFQENLMTMQKPICSAPMIG